MIELPEAIKFSQTIRPARLSENCDDILALEDVIAVGNGVTDIVDQFGDDILRHGHYHTLSDEDCAGEFDYFPDPSGIICAVSMTEQYAYRGDSGDKIHLLEIGYKL